MPALKNARGTFYVMQKSKSANCRRLDEIATGRECLRMSEKAKHFNTINS